MSDFEKIEEIIREKVNDVKSEEEAQRLFLDIRPQLENLTKKYFYEDENDSDVEEFDIDWIGELNEYIAKVVQLYLLYHVEGDLKHIHLILSVENPPNIILTINDQDYNIDYQTFKNGTDENNRDDHRECYFRNESIWFEFQSYSPYFDISNIGEELCKKLEAFFPLTLIDYDLK